MSLNQIAVGWVKTGEPSPCLSPQYQGYDTCQHTPSHTPRFPPRRRYSSTTTKRMSTLTAPAICQTPRGCLCCPLPVPLAPLLISTSAPRSSTVMIFPRTSRAPVGLWATKMKLRNPATVTKTSCLLPSTAGAWDSWLCSFIRRAVVPPDPNLWGPWRSTWRGCCSLSGSRSKQCKQRAAVRLGAAQGHRDSPLPLLLTHRGLTQLHHPDSTPRKGCGTASEPSHSHLSTTLHHLPQHSTSTPASQFALTVTFATRCATEAALPTLTSATRASALCLSAEPDLGHQQRGAAARPEQPQPKVRAQEDKAATAAVEEEPKPQLAPQLEGVISGTCRLQAMPVSNPRSLGLTRTAEVRWGKAASELTLRQMWRRSLVAAKQLVQRSVSLLQVRERPSPPREWRRTGRGQRQKVRPLKPLWKELQKSRSLSPKHRLAVSRMAKQKMCILLQSKPYRPTVLYSALLGTGAWTYACFLCNLCNTNML